MKPTLEFNWKCDNIEMRACPKRLVHMYYGEPNSTIDVVLWHKDANGNPYCFSIAYFVRGKEGYYLKFVGARPLLYVSEEHVPALWGGLQQAQDVLDRWFDDTDGGAEDEV